MNVFLSIWQGAGGVQLILNIMNINDNNKEFMFPAGAEVNIIPVMPN